jgi:hypothetical protein
VNLNGGNAVSDADCELLGRLLTRFLFFHVMTSFTWVPSVFVSSPCLLASFRSWWTTETTNPFAAKELKLAV